jgi:1-acyl-sn-glycerol-3-phosphate acyltransferase
MAFSLQPAWYQLARCACRVFFTFGFSLRTEGLQNIPARGPFLIVANHESYLDPPAIGCSITRPLFYLARKSLWKNPVFGALLTSVNSLPVDQDTRFVKDAMKLMIAKLQEGYGTVMFPEGTRTEDGNMNPLQPGILFLLKYLPIPVQIVPVGIAGFYQAWPMHNKFPKFAPLFLPAAQRGTLAISYGKPVDSESYRQLDRPAILADLFQRIATERARAEKIRRKPID